MHANAEGGDDKGEDKGEDRRKGQECTSEGAKISEGACGACGKMGTQTRIAVQCVELQWSSRSPQKR